MHEELADFLDYCRIERRLAPLTCSAYERDVSVRVLPALPEMLGVLDGRRR